MDLNLVGFRTLWMQANVMSHEMFKQSMCICKSRDAHTHT